VLDNPKARAIEQKQVFAVFEDEAQDSTPLQTKLLETLAIDPERPNSPPNFIRVGDPNQALILLSLLQIPFILTNFVISAKSRIS